MVASIRASRHARVFAWPQPQNTHATTLLESGVTTIRTLGDVGYEVVTLRDQIDAGQILGPRILASGPLMAIPEGHGAPLIALTSGTPEEARTAVAQNLKAGVNAIKIAMLRLAA